MIVRLPPQLANWILRHFAGGPYKDALIGDLFEQYQDGRGGVWYWRQVATTVFITGLSSLRLPGRKLVKLTVAAFAIVALGVGTFTWAKTIKDGTVLKDCMIAKSAQAIECQKR